MSDQASEARAATRPPAGRAPGWASRRSAAEAAAEKAAAAELEAIGSAYAKAPWPACRGDVDTAEEEVAREVVMRRRQVADIDAETPRPRLRRQCERRVDQPI